MSTHRLIVLIPLSTYLQLVFHTAKAAHVCAEISAVLKNNLQMFGQAASLALWINRLWCYQFSETCLGQLNALLCIKSSATAISPTSALKGSVHPHYEETVAPLDLSGLLIVYARLLGRLPPTVKIVDTCHSDVIHRFLKSQNEAQSGWYWLLPPWPYWTPPITWLIKRKMAKDAEVWFVKQVLLASSYQCS